MKRVLSGVRSVIERATGVRRLGHVLDSRLVAVHGNLTARIDGLHAELAERDRLAAERADVLRERFDRLVAQLAQHAGKASERDETIQNLLRDLGGRVDIALDAARRESVPRALSEIRAEISSLRAEIAYEAETKDCGR